MSNVDLNKLKKKVQKIRTDFQENNYYIKPENVFNDESFTKTELELIRVLAKLIAKGQIKEPPETVYTVENIAKHNNKTKDEIINILFEELATEKSLNDKRSLKSGLNV